MNGPGKVIEQRLGHLENHLEYENPVLLEVVRSFRELDSVAYRMGLLDAEQSFATRIPWWPLVAILGTFSAGKSTFINHYLGSRLQNTGNQAVDDKFTVISFSKDKEPRVLPGLALDADPRFPFFRVSKEIEKVAAGEGKRIDAYLQLKTCASEELRGKILIDSPGFDADAQRTSTLRITNHIIDLSDLVLVFFDARHPEPGSMQDTLQHLVGNTVKRHDSNKFLYILNQLDTTAREDNPEEVVAAWQRALSQKGLTAGRFYGIYNPDAAVPIDDPNLRRRFESKRDKDMAEIKRRIQQVETERAYRIVGALDKTANAILSRDLPQLREYLADWRRRTLSLDAVFAGALIAIVIGLSFLLGTWQGLDYQAQWFSDLQASAVGGWILLAPIAAVALAGHVWARKLARGSIVSRIRKSQQEGAVRDGQVRGFLKSTRWWRCIFQSNPSGWGRASETRIKDVLNAANEYVQRLNDSFTNPSGAEEKVQAEDATTIPDPADTDTQILPPSDLPAGEPVKMEEARAESANRSS